MKDSKLFPRKVYNLEDNTKFQDLRNHMYDSVYLSNIYITSKPVKVLKDFVPFGISDVHTLNISLPIKTGN